MAHLDAQSTAVASAPEPTDEIPSQSSNVRTVQQLREQGLSVTECRDAGHALTTAYQCKVAGFTPAECKIAGFNATDCQRAGYTVQECGEAGFPYCVPCSGRGIGGELSNKFNCHHCGGDGKNLLLINKVVEEENASYANARVVSIVSIVCILVSDRDFVK